MFSNINRPSAVDVLRPFAVGDSFYADTTSTLAKRAIGNTNDILTVSGGVPVWSSAIVVTSLSVIDSGFFIIGSADATKRINFEVDAQTAGDTLTINTGAQTDSRTLSVPVLAGSDTIATLAVANAFTGTVSVIDGSFSIVGSSDASKTMRFEVDAQTAADDLTINSGAQTDDRTATFPVLTGNSILTLSNATLTTTCVPFATTNGILTDSANFTFSTTVCTIANTTSASASTNGSLVIGNGNAATTVGIGGGNINCGGTLITGNRLSVTYDSALADVGNGVGPIVLSINGAASTTRDIQFKTAGTVRWLYRVTDDAESGSDAGSNFTINARADGGGSIDFPLTITRAANGPATFARPVVTPAATTSIPSIRLPHGTAPSSPTNGDMWTTTAGLFVRINGVTVGPLS